MQPNKEALGRSGQSRKNYYDAAHILPQLRSLQLVSSHERIKSCADEKTGGFVCQIHMDRYLYATYMHLGHCPAGAVDLATDWNQMVTWALNFFTCGELAHDVTKMNNGQREVIHTHHEEVSKTK